MRNRILLACVVLFVFAAGISWSQESRGSITGKVVDPQGAVIPGATVVITNTETNVPYRTATNVTGYFEVSLLNPGNYSVTVEASGFKKHVRTGLVLNVAGRIDIEIEMQVGQLAETVEITAQAPLLDTTSASSGRVIDSREVIQLPFSDMNPFALTAIAPGMQWTGQPEYRRPFDNAGTSAFNTMGGVGQNEYTIDGAPATGTGRRVGFVPSSDAVEEFKMETASFDASYGHTSGATVNVSTKSGTNTYHGSLFDQHWQQRWNATPHFTRLLYERNLREGKAKPGDPKQATGRSNQFGANFGGPVRIPKIYNGRDKLFFFFHYDGIYQNKAETTSSINRTVPKMAWRDGDFSDMLALDPVKYTIYDPRSARQEGSRVVRTPFPGNKGIPVLNPVYKFYAALYPKPNDVPGLVSAEGANNYYGAAMPKNERFNAIVNRVDYAISDKHRLFGRWYWNHRLADEYDWMYETKRGLQANGLTRINKGAGGDWIWMLSSSTVLDLGVNYMRFAEGAVNAVATSYKPSDVGLPKYLDDKAGDYHQLPRIQFPNIADVTGGNDTYPVIGTLGSTGELKLAMTTLRGSHSIKYGWQERRYWFTALGPGNASGNFGEFNQNYVRQADNTTTASNVALEWAAFMLALPGGINIDTNDSALISTRFRSFYINDDWRLSSKLRLSLGLRYEREAGMTERFNRGVSGGLDDTYRPPFAAAAEAAYAKNPIPELAASQFKVQGGFWYLGTKYGKTFTDGTHKFLPRVGLVYQVGSKMVIRGGYGMFSDTFNPMNDRGNQNGYSQATSTAMTTDLGLSFCCGTGAASGLSSSKNPMVDPFPVRADGTRFNTPYGNTLGAVIAQGASFNYWPRNYEPAMQHRWRLGFQRELRRDMVIEASYNGSWSSIPVTQRISNLPQQYWATGSVRNNDVDNSMNANITNPFNLKLTAPGLATSDPLVYTYLTTSVGLYQGTTIRRHELLRAYSNMGNNLRLSQPNFGRMKYHDFELQLEKRMGQGLKTAVMYTRAFSDVQDWMANEFDQAPTWRPNNNTLPHRLAWTAIYDVPFGKGRKWVNSNPIQHVVGGWTFSWIYQFQSGPATGDWGNRFFYGDLNAIGDLFKHDSVHSQDIHVWFDPNIRVTSGTAAIASGYNGFEGRTAFQPGSYHVRVFPIRLAALRADGIRNWDVKVQRNFRITERLSTKFALDLLNATNHTNFAGPNLDPTSSNFGKVDTQRGLSRIIQFNLRIDF